MLINYLFFSALAGLHRALWGAYKDSPYEPYKLSKTLRSIIIAGIWGSILFLILPVIGIERNTVSPAYIFLMAISLDTITTEFYKLFIRSESQEIYAIPSRFNFFKKRVSDSGRLITLLILTLLLGIIFYIFSKLTIQNIFIAALIGILGGFLEAFGGMWKDAPFEGFQLRKFFRSPLIGLFWGTVLSLNQPNLGILFFSALGADRMTIEFYKTFIKRQKVGKFKAPKPTFPEWSKKRNIFIFPYIITWIIFLIYFLYPFAKTIMPSIF